MLEQLDQLTALLAPELTAAGLPALSFAFGTEKELNILADHQGDYALLFHEGYTSGGITRIGNGSLRYDYALSLLILYPSSLSDGPDNKQQTLAILAALMQKVFLRLDGMGVVQGARFTSNLLFNLTDRNYDAVRLSLTLTPPTIGVCL
ncbi:hypothetical protein [Spirosoma sp. KUDC1026]|uniref:hypothetical protein n=1 Tax=Spirosoma sp. KUDC1026 TaxID=2745947 RepID=UPI00159BBEF9|nr:hypothetical protein [Spirosoma sp. KUDC1026]QKZ15191.1 hypothetical protein HU175_22220 [Spirosoma sp. KUDC1026]